MFYNTDLLLFFCEFLDVKSLSVVKRVSRRFFIAAQRVSWGEINIRHGYDLYRGDELTHAITVSMPRSRKVVLRERFLISNNDDALLQKWVDQSFEVLFSRYEEYWKYSHRILFLEDISPQFCSFLSMNAEKLSAVKSIEFNLKMSSLLQKLLSSLTMLTRNSQFCSQIKVLVIDSAPEMSESSWLEFLQLIGRFSNLEKFTLKVRGDQSKMKLSLLIQCLPGTLQQFELQMSNFSPERRTAQNNIASPAASNQVVSCGGMLQDRFPSLIQWKIQ